MSIFTTFALIGFIIFLVVYLLAQYVFNDRQIYLLKYSLYVSLVMVASVVFIPLFVFRPRNALNIRLSAIILNPILRLFGVTYRIENGKALEKTGPYVVVANHQSSLDFIGMMRLWPDFVCNGTILAKKELIKAGPFGISAWLSGVEFVDRKNRERSSATMRALTKKVNEKALRLWIFPEGTRHMGETFLPFKVGAFRVAIQAQIPIVPVVFSSYKTIYSADKLSKIYFWRKGCVTIKCLEPIETTGMTLEKDLDRLIEITRQQMLDVYSTIYSKTTLIMTKEE